MMGKLIGVTSVVSSLLFVASGCNQQEQQAEFTYASVSSEMQTNLGVCQVDTRATLNGNLIILESSKSDVILAATHYDQIVDALSSIGISIEFVQDARLPLDCHWSDLALKFNFGSSSLLRSIANLSLDKDGRPSSFFKDRTPRMDVLRVSISGSPYKVLSELNNKNMKDPTKIVVETDPTTGTTRRVFTVYVNPGSASFSQDEVIGLLFAL